MNSPRVLVAGPVSWNRIVRLDSLPEARPHTVFANGHHDALGGTSAGKALNLASLGVAVTLYTVLGEDREGDLVRAALDHPLIDLVAETGDVTEQHLNLMDPEGGRLSLYLDLPRVPETLVHREQVHRAMAECSVAVLDLAELSRPLLAAAREAGRPVWCDVHDYDGRTSFHRAWVEAADVLFLNDDGLTEPHPFMRERVAAGTGTVVCTRGAAGAVAVTAEVELDVPALPAREVVDTNGAGDAFFAGFLVARQAGRGVEDAVRAGHRQAVASLASPGLAPR